MEKPRAFTLIELLTVIAIIGILAAIMIPVLGRVRSSARAATCRSNLRQIGVAMHLYADDNKGMVVYDVVNGSTGVAGAGGTWNDALRRYVSVGQLIVGLRPTGVFACPEGSALVSNTNKSDYGKNYYVNAGEHESKRKYRITEVQPAVQVIAFADATARRFTETEKVIANRHGGKANLIYFDNHLATVDATTFEYGGGGKLPLYPQP